MSNWVFKTLKFNPVSLSHYPAPIRLGSFVVILMLLWIPLAAPIYLVVSDRNTASIVTVLLLYLEFIALAQFWGWQVYRQPNLIWYYGLELSRRFGVELSIGLAIGTASLFALFTIEGLLGWLVWQVPSTSILRVVLEGFIVALAIGFAEELLFRGWLLDELQRDYCPTTALLADSTAFAVLHFIKPFSEIRRTLPQFPALLILGLVLVWAKRSRGGFYQLSRNRWTKPVRRDRLGLPIGLHAGLVWGYYIINVGNLIKYSNRVPEWMTGIDKNPLSGAIGLFFLSALAFGVWRYSKSQTYTKKRG